MISSIATPRKVIVVFFLMIRRPPRSTLDRSSAASDVYKRQVQKTMASTFTGTVSRVRADSAVTSETRTRWSTRCEMTSTTGMRTKRPGPVSYTHLRAHETVLDLVCRLLLETKKKTKKQQIVLMMLSRSVHYTTH